MVQCVFSQGSLSGMMLANKDRAAIARLRKGARAGHPEPRVSFEGQFARLVRLPLLPGCPKRMF